MSMRILRTVEDVVAWRNALSKAGDVLALVPTMGYLHDGHVSLMKEAARRTRHVAVSIFVNPTQFGPSEDLDRYPRDFDGDLRKCDAAGVEVVFAPDPVEVYPTGFQTYVDVTQVSQGLCGDRRPGHFRGVATVVAKLLAMFRPQVALFGEKDFQQLQVIKALNRDLHLGVEILGMPTIRESDGLAMSSRNAYLTPSERKRALSLHRGLSTAQNLVRQGQTDVARLVSAVRSALTEGQVVEDYIEVVDATTLRPIDRLTPSLEARMLVAGFVGKTRLIDNVSL